MRRNLGTRKCKWKKKTNTNLMRPGKSISIEFLEDGLEVLGGNHPSKNSAGDILISLMAVLMKVVSVR
jgi:hypothetical protein